MSVNQPILFYDGVCYLCHGLVQFILKYESRPSIYFAHLQSSLARQNLQESLLNDLSTVVLFDPNRNKAWVKSAAIVRVLFLMGGWWRLLAAILWLIPLPIRQLGYFLVARYRYKWFGHSNECMLIDDRERFFVDG